jgi:hypothetical protein
MVPPFSTLGQLHASASLLQVTPQGLSGQKYLGPAGNRTQAVAVPTEPTGPDRGELL